MSDHKDGMSDEMREKIINEEYKIWKKNTPFLYDLILTHALVWPSLTVQWFPNKQVTNAGFSRQSLLLGTHTSDEEQNYVIVADVRLPLDDTEIDPRKYDDQKSDVGGFGNPAGGKIDIRIKIPHQGEVNRARYMPQDETIIATQTTSADIHVFDSKLYTNVGGDVVNPQLRLKGQSKEGYGLSWNVLNRGKLLSSSDDSKVCLWDINADPKGGSLNPLSIFTKHEEPVEDVAWSLHQENYFGSVGDDQRIMIWDTRHSENPVHNIIGHSAEVNCISFNPFNEFLFATGSNDKLVKTWDLRNMTQELHSFISHTDQIYQVQWSPFNESILGSCGQDRRLLIWDMSRIGKELTEEESIDGPPELLFIHGGHTSKISDFSFNSNDPWVVASVSEDNILQVWQMSEYIYSEDDEEIPTEP